MNLNWTNAMCQTIIWMVVLFILFQWFAKKLTRRVRPLRIALILILLAFLLGMIPNLQFGGPGKGGEGDLDGEGASGNVTGGGSEIRNAATFDLLVRVRRHGGGDYQLWLEPVNGLGSDSLQLSGETSITKSLVEDIRRIRSRSVLPDLIRCRLDIPDSLSSDVARNALEDALRSAGCAIVTTE